MASIALLVGGALVNALAFSGSNFLFSMLRDPSAGDERKRHDQAVEQLQAAQVKWSRKRSERLDWINENLRRQGHAVHTFRDVDEAIRQYNLILSLAALWSRWNQNPSSQISTYHRRSNVIEKSPL